jgi:hypothetical protein
MTKPKTKKYNPETHTKAELMRKMLRQNIDISRKDAGLVYGDEGFFASSQFSTIKGEINEEMEAAAEEAEARATNPTLLSMKPKPEKRPAQDALTKLQYENRYLRWQLEGERQSFFERWLEENEK